MRYLVSVGLGPVQDFIAAARRCRDLWYGSRLLSEVSKAAALRLAQDGAKLIFPAPDSLADLEIDSPFTVANKLLAVVDTDDVAAVVGAAKAAAEKRLDDAARIETWRLRGTRIDWRRYHSQLRTVLEFYAAWTPYANYKSARARVEHLAAGRKALRNFQRFEGQEGVPKSSLDGIRENVVLERSSDLYQSQLKDEEWLDAIGVVKRFGDYSRFDSTIDVAAVPFVRGRTTEKPDVMERYRQYVCEREWLPKGTYALLYQHDSRQIFDGELVDDPELEAIRKKLGKEPNPPYYAFLIGDGDRMGEAIGKIEEEEEHRKFSSKLSRFAEAARKLIDGDEYRGCSIYCGGDDVVALLPLDRALDCARAVNAEFHEAMGGYNVTFSAGLVVAHALEPLQDVREWARKAERAAKDPKRGDRNALCVAVWPRSGAPVKVFGKWNEFPEVLDRIAGLYVNKKLSLGLAHEFRDLLVRIREWDELHEAVPQMAKAIAARKEQQKEAVQLVEELAKDWNGLDRLCRTMLAARPFARARKEAS
ncbi:MAG: type III-B CRISPR-associated protein Cas10/Cmr2 [Bryobacteraceae bacterium]